jgi:hypothetical protein
MTNQKSLEDACLDIKCGTIVEFKHRKNTYRLHVDRPFKNTEKRFEPMPIRLEPVVRRRDKNGVVITSIEIEFRGANGDQEISAISFKIRGDKDRIRLEPSQISVIDEDGKPIEFTVYLRQLSRVTAPSN